MNFLCAVKIMVKSREKTKIVITTPKSLCSIRTIPIPKSLLNILLSYKTSAIGYLLINSEMKYIKMYWAGIWCKKSKWNTGTFQCQYHTESLCSSNIWIEKRKYAKNWYAISRQIKPSAPSKMSGYGHSMVFLSRSKILYERWKYKL